MRSKVVIIGLGQIGAGYDLTLDDAVVYSHARAFHGHQAFEIVAGVDPDETNRARFSAAYSVQTFADVTVAIDQIHADVAVVAVPTSSHRRIVRTVLERLRPRLILCEKPLAYDLEEAQGLVDDCAIHGVPLFVNYVRRSDPGVREVKLRIDRGDYGDAIKGFAWYSKGLIHNGSHFVNLLEYWLGPVEGGRVLTAGRMWDAHDPEPDVLFRFSRGQIVMQAVWEETYSHTEIELLAPAGRLRYEKGGEAIHFWPVATDPQFPGCSALSEDYETIPSGRSRYQRHVVDQLALVMQGLPGELCTGVEALKTLESIARVRGTVE